MFCAGRLASLSRGGQIYGLTWRAFGSGIWFDAGSCLVVVPGAKSAYWSRVRTVGLDKSAFPSQKDSDLKTQGNYSCGGPDFRYKYFRSGQSQL